MIQTILEYATPPNSFLDASIRPGPYSPWAQALRQLKSFVLVCSMWWDVGIEFLYRDVTIRRIGQIPALLRTLTANPKLGLFVRSLRTDCFIFNLRGYDDVFEQGLAQILSYCPYNTVLGLSCRAPANYSHFPELPDATWLSLRKLEIGQGHSLPHISASLALCSNLVSLSILFDGHSNDTFDATSVQLDVLEDLHFTRGIENCGETTSASFFRVVSEQWSLPRLKRFTVLWIKIHREHVSEMDCHPLLIAHGKNLTHLSILIQGTTGIRVLAQPMDIQRLLGVCPSLQHLALHQIACPDYLSHPKLEYLDLWAPLSRSTLSEQRSLHEGFSQRSCMPAFRKLRFLDLDSLVQPKMTWRYPGVSVCHGPYYVMKGDYDPLEVLPDDERTDTLSYANEFELDTDSEDGDWIPPSHTPSDYSDDYDEEGNDFEADLMLSFELQETLEVFEEELARQEARIEDEETRGVCSYTGGSSD
ncbi:hypothetical protein HYDPIDRAFT_28865 [Hydnomerulius pinastri MD-312]|uniref:F-box domain-containing protein n=1 Tax=Hydnomerulius pinastri MD-312 TaxID=994086 RepID=A0A0C9VEH9_9AGAM|nr:hypothetical protein HYDPIDRAFT_28865 [Hydnomerulius pinastri MD-312]